MEEQKGVLDSAVPQWGHGWPWGWGRVITEAHINWIHPQSRCLFHSVSQCASLSFLDLLLFIISAELLLVNNNLK